MSSGKPENDFFVVERISKSYGSNVVLSDLSLCLEPGEFVCVLGRTGCGKSTLLKIMAGIERPDAGRIIFRGKERAKKNTPLGQSRFGLVFQQDKLMDWRTVSGNVRFPLEIFGGKAGAGTKRDVMARVEEALEIVGLGKFKNLYPHELSGGMRQRVAIARSLVHDPEVLFLDQPFGAVDAITKVALSGELRGLWRRTRKTIVMVTNSVDEALSAGSRVAVMNPSPAGIAGIFEVAGKPAGQPGKSDNAGPVAGLRREIRARLENLPATGDGYRDVG
ncbi:MAG: ABC transporter ATP-binding protein [Deltaproteobacteria bacterium]|nr:ABC transporter ATP-binding protein [Deltaproteobacteria bacterium]